MGMGGRTLTSYRQITAGVPYGLTEPIDKPFDKEIPLVNAELLVDPPVLKGEIPFLVSFQKVLSPKVGLDQSGMAEETIIYNPNPITLPD